MASHYQPPPPKIKQKKPLADNHHNPQPPKSQNPNPQPHHHQQPKKEKEKEKQTTKITNPNPQWDPRAEPPTFAKKHHRDPLSNPATKTHQNPSTNHRATRPINNTIETHQNRRRGTTDTKQQRPISSETHQIKPTPPLWQPPLESQVTSKKKKNSNTPSRPPPPKNKNRKTSTPP